MKNPCFRLLLLLSCGFLSLTVSAEETGTECAKFCLGLQASCGVFKKYPFASTGECLNYCEKLEPEPFACRKIFLAGVDGARKKGKNGKHMCVHAWGSLGEKECKKVLSNQE
jgi:hypothetical protein